MNFLLTLSNQEVRLLFFDTKRKQKRGKIWQSVPNGENRGRYEIEPENLSAEQIAVLIMYPFWSRMGGSFEKEFLDDGRLKKYLSALHKKANEK